MRVGTYYCLGCKRVRQGVVFERIAFIGGQGIDAGLCPSCAEKAKG